jgi:hypothetical protein
LIGQYQNSYAIEICITYYEYWFAGVSHQFLWPAEGAIQPRWELNSLNVYGCGLVLDPENKLWIFFTLNGNILGELVRDVLSINKISGSSPVHVSHCVPSILD